MTLIYRGYPSFNRTTVECIGRSLTMDWLLDFNRTTVECKFGYGIHKFGQTNSFNRTTVECKSFCKSFFNASGNVLIELQ